MSTYSEKLRDPRWQKKRLEILERDKWTCQGCGSKDKELQIHHTVYESGKKPWEHNSERLKTLCSDCHSMPTEAVKRFREAIAHMTPEGSLALSSHIRFASNTIFKASELPPNVCEVIKLMPILHRDIWMIRSFVLSGLLPQEKADAIEKEIISNSYPF